MSWFAGLAEKAEDFLIKVDQSAAVVLSKNDDTPNINYNVAHQEPNRSSYYPSHPILSSAVTSPLKTSLNPSASVPSNLGAYSSNNSVLKKSNTSVAFSANTSPARKKEKQKDIDEKLFEFLNSSETSNPKMDKPKINNVVLNGNHSRDSSLSSIQSSKSSRTEGSSSAFDIIEKTESEETLKVENFSLSEVIVKTDENVQTSSSSYENGIGESSTNHQLEFTSISNAMIDNRQKTSVELENQLLRNEISSLNQEMGVMFRRVKHSEEELERSKKKLEHWNSQISHTDHIIRELQSREADLMEALNAKDSQLAVLRVRLQEADGELRIKRDLLENLSVNNNRILKDNSESNDIQNQAIDSLRDKLQETEQVLHREREALKNVQAEAFERSCKMEQDQRSLAEALTNAQKKLSEEKNRSSEFANQLKTTKSHLESAKQELGDYKQKAQRILQSKEKLIVGLKAGSGSSSTELSSLTFMELEELRQEKDILKDDLQIATMTVENLRSEIQELENQLQLDTEVAEEKIKSLEEQFEKEKRRREDLEQDYNKQKEELKYLEDELHRQKTSMLSRIQDRDKEIEKLRKQLTTKVMNSSSQNELEARLHALTENLIQKQTMLEALGTEKNSLVLQLERLEQNYKELQNSVVRTNTAAMIVNDSEEVRSRIPGFLRESPFDTGVTKSVKRAYNTIDKFSVRLGVFLRRYPIARIFVIFYMIIIHFWVMIVLFTYSPEIHDASHFLFNKDKKGNVL